MSSCACFLGRAAAVGGAPKCMSDTCSSSTTSSGMAGPAEATAPLELAQASRRVSLSPGLVPAPSQAAVTTFAAAETPQPKSLELSAAATKASIHRCLL